MARSDAGTSLGSEYQVFLSFRGSDTCKVFADVLFHNLTDAGIYVFQDKEELRNGASINGMVKRAIDNSRIYIPIFSQSYAASQWCLRELAQIVENTSRSEGNKEILPIFFDVERDDVKLKTPLYRNAILALECNEKLSNEEVDAWKEALTEIDKIKGLVLKEYKGHGELIKIITEEIFKKLKTTDRLVTKHLVGIDDQVVEICKLLDFNSNDVRFILIYGMGGIGKTTLAKVVFNQFSSRFGKCCCFLEDVRVNSLKIDGVIKLQQMLLCKISHSIGISTIDTIDDGMARIGYVLSNKKVLLVLDDVDNHKQLKILVGERTLGLGSRILITTRNKDVLPISRSKHGILKYEMEVMCTNHALELFSRHAFNRDSPLDGYNDLAKEIISAVGRLPLALESIGSFLHNKPRPLWKETLHNLRKSLHQDVFQILKISYDALSFEQQQIFLDIACFFIGEDMTNAIYMWRDCDFYPISGVEVLINMALVKIVEKNKFWMHDQLRDLGRQIVRFENFMNPGERSRLWTPEEIFHTITTEEMKNNVQTLDIDLRQSNLKDVTSEEIGRFKNLRCLKLNGGTFIGNSVNCLTNLRWFFWSHPPLTSNPVNMHFKNVVVLHFSDNYCIDDSNLQSLIKVARRLAVLSLESCHSITKTPDFSGNLKLERLTLENCSNLREIDHSIGKLKCLIDLKIDTCLGLKCLPEEIGDLVNLKHFFVQRTNVKKLPYSIRKLKLLKISLEFEPVKEI